MAVLAGSSALITGAASGLGRALARRFVQEGVSGLAIVDVDSVGLEEVAREVSDEAAGVHVVSAVADMTDAHQVSEAFDSAARAFGGLDVVVNNAGIISPSARTHNTAVEDLRRVLDVNVVGTFNGMAEALRLMRPQGHGVIINTASVAGLTAWSHAGPYCASKAAVILLTKVAAVEYATQGIRINCVCPGTFRSAIHEGLPDEALDALAERHPMKRLADIDEVVGAFVYLAGPDSTWTTGTALVVDGGYSAP